MDNPALRNRFMVSTTPTQMNGNDSATIVARNPASLPCKSVIRATSRTGTQ